MANFTFLTDYLTKCYHDYIEIQDDKSLVKLFMALPAYSLSTIGELPKIKVIDLFNYNFQLDNSALTGAYCELLESPSVDAVENMMLVIIMLFKAMDGDYARFLCLIDKA